MNTFLTIPFVWTLANRFECVLISDHSSTMIWLQTTIWKYQTRVFQWPRKRTGPGGLGIWRCAKDENYCNHITLAHAMVNRTLKTLRLPATYFVSYSRKCDYTNYALTSSKPLWARGVLKRGGLKRGSHPVIYFLNVLHCDLGFNICVHYNFFVVNLILLVVH